MSASWFHLTMKFTPRTPKQTDKDVPTLAYIRVSTDKQSTDLQMAALASYADPRGWNIGHVFKDVISGGVATRPGLDAMQRHIEQNCPMGCRVLVYKLDRIGRSTLHLANLFQWFNTKGVAFICTSQGIDTSDDSAVGRLQLSIFAAFAEFERSLIQERTKAGLAIARQAGRHGGSPALSYSKHKEIHRLRFVMGLSVQKTAAALKIGSTATIMKWSKIPVGDGPVVGLHGPEEGDAVRTDLVGRQFKTTLARRQKMNEGIDRAVYDVAGIPVEVKKPFELPPVVPPPIAVITEESACKNPPDVVSSAP